MMPAADEITVVMPTFNRVDLLKRSLQSVLQETRVPIVVHVFDNASTDDTPNFLRELAATDPRVRVVTNDENIDVIPNYVKALASVESSFFVPLADDDWLMPDFLFDGYRMLQEHPDAGAAVFYAEAISKDGEVLHYFPGKRPNPPVGYITPADHMREWIKYTNYDWSAIVWRKEALDHVGYPYFHTGKPSDINFQVEVFSRFPAVLSTAVGAAYAIHPDQASRQPDGIEIPSWAKFFANMDKSMGPLFDEAEYQELRDFAVKKWQKAWRTSLEQDIDQKQLLPLATLAGARLNDFETMGALVDLFDGQGGSSNQSLRLQLMRSFSRKVIAHQVETTERDQKIKSLSDSLKDSQNRLRKLEAAHKTLAACNADIEQQRARPLLAIRRWLSAVNKQRKAKRR